MKRFSLSLLAGLLVLLPAGAQTFDAAKCYTVATPEGLVLDAQSSVQTETTMILANPEADNPSQVWQITPLGDGLFRLVNGFSFQALDNANGAEEHPVIQWSADPGNHNQFWFLSRNRDGSYRILSEATGMALGLRKTGAFGDEAWQLKADPDSPLQRWIIRESALKVDFIVPKTSSKNDWENEKVFAINKEPGHPTLIPYASTQEMYADAKPAQVSAEGELNTERIDNYVRRYEKPGQKKGNPFAPKQNDKDAPLVIDLHADALLETTQGMSSADILQYQLDTFKKTIEANKKERGKKIVFIHGKGEGVLRRALIHELTYRYKNLRYQDASFQEYGYGATQVTI